MVTGVIGDGNSGDIVVGIYVNPLAGSTQNIYNNSVSMSGNRGATASMFPSYALAISADFPVNVFDNVLVNSQTRTGTGTGGESYAIGFDGPSANVNLTSNYNDLFVSGTFGQTGITGDLTTAAQAGTPGTGTNQTTLAAWQGATGDDANSLSVDPLFVSVTDLHLQMGSPMINAGIQTPLASGQDINAPIAVTEDFDGQPRDAMPDIGADEYLAPTAAGVSFGGRVMTADGRGISRARVYMTDFQGNVTMRQTNPAGYYRFVEVGSGANYVLTVEHKSYSFPPAQLFFITDEKLDVNFVADGTSLSGAAPPDKQK